MVGSRLRGNETLNNRMALPRPLVQIDADKRYTAARAALPASLQRVAYLGEGH